MWQRKHRRPAGFAVMAIVGFSASLAIGVGLGKAQTRVKPADSAPSQIVAPATAEPDSRTKAAYKKSTWERHQAALKRSLEIGALKAGSTEVALRPTDCPPAPQQVCLDSWKVKTVNPFE